MQTPDPRLPLEPEEYPLYRPPRRIGCSALSAVTLILLFIFAFLFLRVTPGIVEGVKNFTNDKLNLLPSSSDQGTPGPTIGARNLATQTVEAGAAPPPTVTLPPITTPAPVRSCVQIVKSSLQLRSEPSKNVNGIVLPIGTKLQLIEPEATQIKDKAGNTWKQVKQLPPASQIGFVLDNYLSPVPCP